MYQSLSNCIIFVSMQIFYLKIPISQFSDMKEDTKDNENDV